MGRMSTSSMGSACGCARYTNCCPKSGWRSVPTPSSARDWSMPCSRCGRRIDGGCSRRPPESGCIGRAARRPCGGWKRPSATWSAFRTSWPSSSRVCAAWRSRPSAPRNSNRSARICGNRCACGMATTGLGRSASRPPAAMRLRRRLSPASRYASARRRRTSAWPKPASRSTAFGRSCTAPPKSSRRCSRVVRRWGVAWLWLANGCAGRENASRP